MFFLKKVLNFCLLLLFDENVGESGILKLLSVKEDHVNKIFDNMKTFQRKNLPKWIYSIFPYKNRLIKSAIWQMKFRKNIKIAKIFGKILAKKLERIVEENKIREDIIIIPIPIHWRRKIERGFNQTELLCEYIIKYIKEKRGLKIQYSKKILKRIRYTKKQSWSHRSERQKNSTNIFYAEKKVKLQNKTIILIDDVVTTGSTLESAKKILQDRGPKNILGITIAN